MRILLFKQKNVSVQEVVSQISGKIDKWDSYKYEEADSLIGVASVEGGVGFENNSLRKIGVSGGSMPKIAFKVGSEQDINLFRENIKNGHIPNPDVITYNGVNLPDRKCNTIFCPLLAISTGNNLDGSSNYYLQFGLGSNMKEKDFKRQKTNFVNKLIQNFQKFSSFVKNLNTSILCC